MGWLDQLKRKPPKSQDFAQMLNGYTPIFSQFGTNIYASDVVQQAVKCIVDEMKKLNPTHVRLKDNDPVPVTGSVQTVLNNPNPLMTTSEFLEKTMWLLLLNYNAFILPTYYIYEDKDGTKRRYYTGLYPLKPTRETPLPKEERTQGIWKGHFNGKTYAWNSSECARLRSQTPNGVAQAMAEQWGEN